MGVLRRVLVTLREGGPAALLWQALAVAGARRLEIHMRPAKRKAAAPVPGVEVWPLNVGDSSAYQALRPEPEIGGGEFVRRLQAGEQCFGAWRGDRLVGVHWLALDEARVSYLGVSLALGAGVSYDYEAYTEPRERGRGIGNLLGAAVRKDSASRGKSQVLSGILPENRAGAAFIAPWSRQVGTVASVSVWRWRLIRSSVPDVYIGNIRRCGGSVVAG